MAGTRIELVPGAYETPVLPLHSPTMKSPEGDKVYQNFKPRPVVNTGEYAVP